MRSFLARFGMYDKGALRLGLNEVRPDDVFICSYPKSGNTYVRFLLANMLEGSAEITFKNVNDYVPGIYTQRDKINKMESRRFIKTHDAFYSTFPKMIYIYRDYRDVMISYHHFKKSLGEFEGELVPFVRHMRETLPFQGWMTHVHLAHYGFSDRDNVLMLSYESLVDDPMMNAKLIEEFCEIKSKRPLEEVVANCNFSSLQANEETHGNLAGDSTRKFFRSGLKEQWRTEITDEEHAYILDEPGVCELLEDLNYPSP